MTNDHTYVGPSLEIGGSLHGESPNLHGVGMSFGYAYVYAPIIDDLIGNTHASGGHRVSFSLSYSF